MRGWPLGVPRSEEQKRKQAATMKGRYAGEKHPLFGKHLSDETKRKISASRIGRFGGPMCSGWKNGRTTDGEGYIKVFLPDHPNAYVNGYVNEHRLIVERELGRPLKTSEVVHHIDMNPVNNTPENLTVFSSQGKHCQYHRRLNWLMAGM